MATTDVLRPRYAFVRIQSRAVLLRVGTEPPINITGAAETYGVRILEKPLGRSRGVAIHRNGTMEIALNTDWAWHGEGERRWVVAEELGHLLLNHPAIMESVADQDGWVRQATLDAVEREARFFSREVLMPGQAIRRALHFYRPMTPMRVEPVIELMAERFGVTKTAMGYRLEGLRLIQPWEERSRWEDDLKRGDP